MPIVVGRTLKGGLFPENLAGLAVQADHLHGLFAVAPTLSGCRNSLSPSMCLTAFAPGTIGPSIAVVRKILFPQTMGEECPRPAIGVFHLMFFVGLHSVGRFFSRETPCPDGPRHCGQLASGAAPACELRSVIIERRQMTRVMLMRTRSFMLRFPLDICSWNSI